MDRNKVFNLLKKSWAVSWPMILIMFFEFLISMTDVYIAGKINKEVQATIGLVSQIYFMFIVISNSITVGTVSVVSRLFTSKKEDELSAAIFSILITTGFFGIIFSLLGIATADDIIYYLHIPQEIKDYGIPLIKIYAIGLFFHYFLVNTNGILRATKRVKYSLFTMFLASILNISLNFFFVFYTPLGFKGIALSTVISVSVSSVINFYHTLKFITIKRYTIEIVKKVFKIGWPSGVLQISWQLGSTVLFLIIGLIPEKSVEIMAAFTNGIRIEAAIFLPAFAFSLANAVLVGNFLGENNKGDAFKVGLFTAVMGAALVTIITIVIVLNAKNISQFLSQNENVVKESINYLYISMISEPFMAFGVILSGAINGAGDTKNVMIRIISSYWLLRIPLAFLLGIVLKYESSGIWWSMNISIFFQTFLIGRYYFKKRWLYNEI